MARSELEKLIAATHGNGGVGSGLSSLTRLLVDVLHLNQTPKAALTGGAVPPRLTQGKAVHPEGINSARLLKAAPVMPAATGVVVTGSRDLGGIAAQSDQLRRSMTPISAPIPVRAKASSVGNAAASNAPNLGSAGIVKILSRFLGGSALGSIISGITGLFGVGKPAAPVPLYRFDLPQSVAVEAGITRKGQFVPVNHSQSGQVRSNETPQPVGQAVPQSIAADSRWFMDHSEDIASAVKEAMLHSHSLNDVVADL